LSPPHSSHLRIPHTGNSLLILVLSLTLTGCATTAYIKGNVPAPAPTPSGTGFRVGAARIDLTPIPGVPMNYSLDGYISRGFWTRLFTRAIYIEDGTGNAIVLVSSDLPHIPNGLGDRVAENLSKIDATDDLRHLDGAQIILAATHTHHGPENWFSSKLYNGMASPRSGFDPQLFEFIAERITTAIHRAHKNLTPVKKVELRQAKLEHFFRNRSVEAFLLNGESGEFLDGNSGIPDDCKLAEGRSEKRACRAVRSEVEIVEFKDATNTRIASAVFLAAHATVLSATSEIFSGDLFGAAATLVEQERVEGCSDYGAPVVALFNGAQGDVSPTWEHRNRFELVNEDASKELGLAVRLARFICNKEPVATASEVAHEPLKTRFSWLNLEEPLSANEHGCDPRHERCTELAPLSGIPSAGGAQDGRTFFYELGLREGLRSDSRLQHGRKVLALNALGVEWPISSKLSPAGSSPKKIPLGIYQMGDLALVPLPGEFTTIMGGRIRTAVKEALEGEAETTDEKHVLLIGLANGHVSYVTTPEEYDAQFYEGAQNLYGAATGPVIQKEILKLVSSSEPGTRVKGESFVYENGECRVSLPRDAGLPGYDADDGLQSILMDLKSEFRAKRDFPQQCWIDAIPALPKIDETYSSSSEQCERSVPYVWIQKTSAGSCSALPPEFLEDACDSRNPIDPQVCNTAQDPRYCFKDVPQDNCGLDIVTVLHGIYKDRTRWCAFWMPPSGETPSDYKICVAGVTDAPITLVDSSEPAGEFDKGSVGLPWLLQMSASYWSNWNECNGLRTRPVCEMPE